MGNGGPVALGGRAYVLNEPQALQSPRAEHLLFRRRARKRDCLHLPVVLCGEVGVGWVNLHRLVGLLLLRIHHDAHALGHVSCQGHEALGTPQV